MKSEFEIERKAREESELNSNSERQNKPRLSELIIGAFNSAFIQTNETKFKAIFELSWIWFDAEIKLPRQFMKYDNFRIIFTSHHLVNQ